MERIGRLVEVATNAISNHAFDERSTAAARSSSRELNRR